MPPPSYEEVREAIAGCDVDSTNIHIAYDAEVQSAVITIHDIGGSDERRLRCLSEAAHPFYLVELENADQRAAFLSFTTHQSRQRARAEAIEWLRATGALERVPRYDPTLGLEAFAHLLEAACDLPPGSALEVQGSSTLTFRRGFLEELQTTESHGRFVCLNLMLDASNADEHEIHIGFIGNEAVSGDER